MNLILASKSPRRKELLESVGYEFTIKDSDFDESRITPESDKPEEYVKALAFGKAQNVFDSLGCKDRKSSIVLGADTVVVSDKGIMGKPADEKEAVKMLSNLSGKKHSVYTAVALVGEDFSEVFYDKTDVYFYDLTDEEIEEYVMTGEPMDKAGAYGIQGKGKLLVRKIDGDYFTVVGLPVALTCRYLNKTEIKPNINK